MSSYAPQPEPCTSCVQSHSISVCYGHPESGIGGQTCHQLLKQQQQRQLLNMLPKAILSVCLSLPLKAE